MNGILDNQTSSNAWVHISPAMLHERAQTTTSMSFTRMEQSVLRNLEAQMQDYEDVHQTDLTEVQKHYVLPNDHSVLLFLGSHRALPRLLIETKPWLRKYFGDTVFRLRTTSDEDGWETLYADAMWPGEAREAVLRLDQFEDEWWIPNCGPARGALTFTYRLV